MPDVVSAIQGALNSDMQRLDTIANNVANVNTPAFKRAQVSQSAFGQALDNTAAHALQQQGTLQSQQANVVDMSQGAIKFTGNTFHIALKGHAMLQVGDEGENPLYTRKGEMMLDAQGRLALVNGKPVMGENGYIHLQQAPFQIGTNGEVKQNNEQIDRLRLIELENDAGWNPVGQGFYTRNSDSLTRYEPNTVVMQNYLEASNVNTADEMLQMIETTRHFQTTHQILKGYDSVLDNAINKIGDF